MPQAKAKSSTPALRKSTPTLRRKQPAPFAIPDPAEYADQVKTRLKALKPARVRQRSGATFSLYMPAELSDRIDIIVDKLNTNRNALIREALLSYLDVVETELRR